MPPIPIDFTMLYIAAPAVAVDLVPSARQLPWIMDDYSLLMAGVVIATGPLCDRMGDRRMLLAGVVVLGAVSLAEALSVPERMSASAGPAFRGWSACSHQDDLQRTAALTPRGERCGP